MQQALKDKAHAEVECLALRKQLDETKVKQNNDR